MKGIFRAFMLIILVSSSFDIFFNLNLGGFNVRTCYLVSFAFLALYAWKSDEAYRLRFVAPGSFFVWAMFCLAFVWNTQFLSRNIGYMAWLGFNVLMIMAIYAYCRMEGWQSLMRLYMASFFIMALVGLAQFAFSLFGIHILITMWWQVNKLPRINALSYEPSYYATYLLIGFVFQYSLFRKGIFLFSKKLQLGMLLAVVAAIFLSTSRMGILFMCAILAWDFLRMLVLAGIQLRISRLNFALTLLMILAISSVIIRIWTNDKLRRQYLAGTGLESTASHSRDTRIGQMTNVFLVFQQSPLIGYSLGGIAPAIARYYGNDTPDQKKAKEFEGLNIFLEVLAASGIVGFFFFASWLFQVFRVNILLENFLRRIHEKADADILRALRLALIAELLILTLSQNILRPYLWVLIGVMNALYFANKDRFWSKASVSSKP
jgi:hypothetical protein